MDNPYSLTPSRELAKRLKVGSKGNPILAHRSLRTESLTTSVFIAFVFFPLFFEVLIWMNIGHITAFWGDIFRTTFELLKLDIPIVTTATDFYGFKTEYAYPAVQGFDPSAKAVWLNILVSIVLFLISGRFMTNYMPAMYLLRAVLTIQICTSLFFILSDSGSFLDASAYLSNMMQFSAYFLSILPVLFALIYYIFTFSLLRKFLATAFTLGYFVIALPVQYLLHTLIIHYSGALFMPTLYLLFGALFDTLLLVACYSLAMSLGGEKRATLKAS